MNEVKIQSCVPKKLLPAINALVAVALIWTALVAVPQALAQGDTWATKASMPNAVAGPAAGAIGGKLYVAGGDRGFVCGNDTDALEVYDPATDMWTSMAPLPEPRHSGGAGVINGKFYVVGGSSSSCVDPGNARLYVYDPGTDMWTRKADMPTPRVNLAVAVVDSKLYALGGQNGGGALNTFEMYDPGTNAWTTKASFPTGISIPAVGVVNGKLYVAGGLQFCCTSLATLWVYDPATNAWTSKASLPSGRNQAAGGVMNGILYVAGGINATGTDNTGTLFAYDPATDLWTTKAPMSVARGTHAAATINGQLYVVGGNGAGGVGPLSSLEVYTPTPPTCVPPPSGLVSWWPGDGDGNDIQDGNNGTVGGGVSFTLGKVGQAFVFPGVTAAANSVIVADNANLDAQQFTIDAWVKPTGTDSSGDAVGGIVVSKDAFHDAPSPSYIITYAAATGRFRGKVLFTDFTESPFISSASIFPLNSFYHVALTWDGSTLQLYVDGNLEASTNVGSKTILYNDAPLAIGSHTSVFGFVRNFNGLIDELEIFNRALSASEIQVIFNAGSAGKCVCGDGSLDAGEFCDDGNTTNGDCCSATCEFEVGSCDDGDACTTGDACSMGSCVGGAPPTCDDSNVCTDDSCNPATGCVFTNNTAACDDSNACTQTDTCQTGVCTGGNPVTCDDSNVCTDDSCNPATGCVFTNNTAACDDSNACTQTDTCQTGVCTGGNPVTCDDSNVCTDDSCNPATGCVFTNNTAACDDSNACTQTDTCQTGVCTGGTHKDCSTSGLFSAHCRPSDGMCCGKTARRGGTKTCVP